MEDLSQACCSAQEPQSDILNPQQAENVDTAVDAMRTLDAKSGPKAFATHDHAVRHAPVPTHTKTSRSSRKAIIDARRDTSTRPGDMQRLLVSRGFGDQGMGPRRIFSWIEA